VLVGYGDTVARLDPNGNVVWSTVAQNAVFDVDPQGGAVFLNAVRSVCGRWIVG